MSPAVALIGPQIAGGSPVTGAPPLLLKRRQLLVTMVQTDSGGVREDVTGPARLITDPLPAAVKHSGCDSHGKIPAHHPSFVSSMAGCNEMRRMRTWLLLVNV